VILIERVHIQADETTVTVPMPADLDRGALIGKQGVYVQKLESKYDVRINFPNAKGGGDDDASDRPGSDEIVIRGGKKGADSAKKEIIELIAYERENGNTVRFQVSSKALPRIVGRGGNQIRELGDNTGATIDVERGDGETSSVSLRGTKTAIAAAKKAILEIVKEADDEIVIDIPVERSLHVLLIGKGGQNGVSLSSYLSDMCLPY
jgi:transcription antitermination factor NusA-like protein